MATTKSYGEKSRPVDRGIGSPKEGRKRARMPERGRRASALLHVPCVVHNLSLSVKQTLPPATEYTASNAAHHATLAWPRRSRLSSRAAENAARGMEDEAAQHARAPYTRPLAARPPRNRSPCAPSSGLYCSVSNFRCVSRQQPRRMVRRDGPAVLCLTRPNQREAVADGPKRRWMSE